jgi:hypothetical protein
MRKVLANYEAAQTADECILEVPDDATEEEIREIVEDWFFDQCVYGWEESE